MKKKPHIGLALGSGGARGLAHIGIIKVLEQNNIPIDFIAGSSIGALIGGFYAAGISISNIEKIALDTNWLKLFSLVDPTLKQGLVGGKKIETFLKNYIDQKQIENCQIPFRAIATDLKNGEIVVIKQGELARAIRASISIPLVFKPAEIEGRTLADGGLSAPVPADIVREMGADIVIAVNLDKHYHNNKSNLGSYNIANDSLSILRHHLSRLNVEKADLSLDIDLGQNYWYEFSNAPDKIAIGEQAAQAALPKLLTIIDQKTPNLLSKFFKFLINSK